MNERNKNETVFEYTPMPAEPPELLESYKTTVKAEKKLRRRKRRERFGAAVCGLLLAMPMLAKADQIATSELWPSDSPEVILAAGSEGIPKGGEEWLVFGGLGQKYSTNGGQELFNAINQKEVVASLKEPNQKYTIEEIAKIVDAYIRERGMSRLNVVGISAGTPTAFMVLSYIQEHSNAPYVSLAENSTGKESKHTINNSKLPEIGYFAAYSSPADIHDAFQETKAHVVLGIFKNLNPGVTMKYIFSSVDGDGDPVRSLNILNFPAWVMQQKDNIEQTLNGTAPGMYVSKLEFVDEFNASQDSNQIASVLTPSTEFYYFHSEPEDSDQIVKDGQAYSKYQVVLKPFNVVTSYVSTDKPGHAETEPSAVALGGIVSSGSDATKIGNVFFPPQKNGS